jgi:GT2 family glycosyltransferase
MKGESPDPHLDGIRTSAGFAPTIHVVTPVYNRLEKTRCCLDDLKKQTWGETVVWLVDDASTDETPVVIPREYPWVRLIRTGGNRWWTGATNDGIQAALEVADPADWILLLNNDLRLAPDLLQRLLAAASKSQPPALVGAVCLDRKDSCSIVDGGMLVNWWSAKLAGQNQGKDIRAFPSGHEEMVSVLTGRGVLYPTSVFRTHGLFDDRHFQQCGDYSLPALLRKKGYTLKISYDARVFMDQEETDLVNYSSRLKFSDWKKVLFGVRSNRNLRYRFYFAWYGCPRLVLPWYLVIDFARVIVNFLRHCLR